MTSLAVGLLPQLVIAYAVGVVSVLLLLRLRVPAVVGFLLAGVLLGPHGFRLVQDVEGVSTLAEVGVVILLFTIGVEMSLSRLLRMGTVLLAVGLAQMALATLGASGALVAAGSAIPRAVVIGLLLAPSSTTLVLRVLGERGETEAPHGRLSVGVGLVQDLCVVPIMILLPLLAGAGGGVPETAVAIGKAALVVLGTWILARFVVPRAFEAVVETRNRELFALAVILLCLGTAYLAGLAGLSLALGAFLGGLLVSESPYAQQVLGQILPLRDGLAGLFFIGIGMLLDAGWAASNAPMVLGAVAAIVVFKALSTAAPVLAAGYGARMAVLCGVALAQVGEFSFVLIRDAQGLGVLDEDTTQLLLAAAVLSMGASPFLYRAAVPLADLVDRHSRGRVRRRLEDRSVARTRGDHVIVIGYGLTGRNVASALEEHGRSYVVVEMNPDTVRRERAKHLPILFGDAGHPEVLEKAGLPEARLVVVAINDVAGARRIVDAAKRLRSDVHVVARVRYTREAEELLALGADDVVPEELEASIELSARALRAYGLPQAAIQRTVHRLRVTAAVRDRAPVGGPAASSARALAGVDIETHVVGPGAPADGRTLSDLAVGRDHGVTIVGITREGELLPHVAASTRLQAADVVVLVGTPVRLATAASLFRPAVETPDLGGAPAGGTS